MASRRAYGALEEQVAHVLSVSGGPMTPGEVRAVLNADAPVELAYTTVVTVLTRMHAKGLLDRSKTGRSFAYTRIDDPAALAARQLRRMLDRQPDRHAVLSHFVGELASSDSELLRDLLGLAAERHGDAEL